MHLLILLLTTFALLHTIISPLTLFTGVYADPIPVYLQSASVGLESVPLSEFSTGEDDPNGYVVDDEHDDEDKINNPYQLNRQDNDENQDRNYDDNELDDQKNQRRNKKIRTINIKEVDEDSTESNIHQRQGNDINELIPSIRDIKIQRPSRLNNLERMRVRLQKNILTKKRILNRTGINKRTLSIQRQYQRQQRQLNTLNKVIMGIRHGQLSALDTLNSIEKDNDTLSKLMNAPEKLPIHKFLQLVTHTTNDINTRTLQIIRGIDHRLQKGSRVIRKLQLARYRQIYKAYDNIKRIQIEIQDRAEMMMTRWNKIKSQYQRKLNHIQQTISTTTMKYKQITLQTKLHTTKAQLLNVQARIAQQISEMNASLSYCTGVITGLKSRKMPILPGIRKLNVQLKNATTQVKQVQQFVIGRIQSVMIGKQRYTRDKQGRLYIVPNNHNYKISSHPKNPTRACKGIKRGQVRNRLRNKTHQNSHLIKKLERSKKKRRYKSK